jgi:hypothetical protein
MAAAILLASYFWNKTLEGMKYLLRRFLKQSTLKKLANRTEKFLREAWERMRFGRFCRTA